MNCKSLLLSLAGLFLVALMVAEAKPMEKDEGDMSDALKYLDELDKYYSQVARPRQRRVGQNMQSALEKLSKIKNYYNEAGRPRTLLLGPRPFKTRSYKPPRIRVQATSKPSDPKTTTTKLRSLPVLVRSRIPKKLNKLRRYEEEDDEERDEDAAKENEEMSRDRRRVKSIEEELAEQQGGGGGAGGLPGDDVKIVELGRILDLNRIDSAITHMSRPRFGKRSGGGYPMEVLLPGLDRWRK